MLFLLPWMRFRPRWPMVALHAALILQMPVLGGHFVPHPASVRTLSGQLFAAGVCYFVWANLSARMGLTREDRSPRGYAIGLAVILVIVQAIIRAPFAWTAPLVELLAMIGVCALLLGAFATSYDIVLRIARKGGMH